MKIILIDVMSIDGRLTKWKDGKVSNWNSPEELAFFKKTIAENDLIVMGGNAFRCESIHSKPGKLKIIMTRKPEQYQKLAVLGQLEFTSEKPTELVARLEKSGYQQMLFVGGPTLATEFFKKNLINELWVSIEPKIFGQGRALITKTQLDINLQLFESRQLNDQGTMLLRYKIL